MKKAFVKATTPRVLQALSLLAIVFTVVLWFVVRAAYLQNRRSAQVIGETATSGIVAAQKLKVDLARMDASFARQLVANDLSDDSARSFSDARKDVSASLVDASKNVHFGVAETVPIERIQYVLPLYQAAVTAALEARTAGNTALVTNKAVYAHQLMADYLLPAADQLDEANSTAMNNAYDEQVVADQHVNTDVLIVGLILAVFLVGVQVYMMQRFHRLVNPALVLALALSVGLTLYANSQFSSIGRHLAQAKEDVFQRLHVMWRAEARVEQAHAAMLFKLLPGESGEQFDRELRESEARVLALPAGLQAAEFARQASADPTGYLAMLAREHGSVDDRQELAQAIIDFGEFTAAGQQSQQAEQALGKLLAQLRAAKQSNETAFREHAASAFSALQAMEALALGIGLGVAGLSFIGVRSRLLEYKF